METIILGVLFVVAVLGRELMIRDENKAIREERRELLNRIKPETAQIPNVDLEQTFETIRTDEDWWDAHETTLKEEGSYPYGFEEEARGR